MSRNRINYNVQDIFIGPCPASGYHFINYSGGLNNNHEDFPYVTYEDFRHISPNPAIINTLISKDKNENTFPRNHNLLKRLDRIQDVSYQIRSNRTIINQLNSGNSYVDNLAINNPEVDISFSYILSSLRNEARMGFNVNYPRLDYPYTGDKYFYRTDNGVTLPKRILLQGWANEEGGVNINGEYTYTINFDISIIQGGFSAYYNGYKHNTLNSFIYFAGGWQFLTTSDPSQWDNPSTNSNILPLNGWIENNAQGPAGTITSLENEPLFLFSGFLNRDYIKPEIFPDTIRGEGLPINSKCFGEFQHISPNQNVISNTIAYYTGRYDCITNDPYWPLNTKDRRNIFIAISENEDDQNENLNETFSDPDDQTFISRSADKKSKTNRTIGFGNCYISSYTQRGQVGDFIRAGVTYVGENMSLNLSGSGVDTPYVDPKTNMPNSTVKFNIPSEINSRNPISALLPSDLKIQINESDTTNLLNLKNSAFTAYEFNINFEREKMEAIGYKLPIDREINTPFIINLKLDLIVENNNDLNFLSFVRNDCNKNYNIKIDCGNYCNYDSNFIWSGQNQSSLFEKRFKNAFNYEFFNCKFDNVSYSSTIGSKKIATFNFSTLTDKQNYDRSLQMSGILGIEKIEDFVLIESDDKSVSLTIDPSSDLSRIYSSNTTFNDKNYYVSVERFPLDNKYIYFDSNTNTWKLKNNYNNIVAKSNITNVDTPDLVDIWNQFIGDYLVYKPISGLSLGLNYFYINFTDRTITGYGDNSYGQLVNDISQNNFDGFFTGIWENTKPGKLNNVIKVETNYSHTLALLSNKTITGWGSNDDAQVTSLIVDNDINNLFTGNWNDTPVGKLTNVNDISAGAYHSLALLSNGTLTGWGDSTYNQATGGRFLSNITGISAGGYHSLAIRNISNGTVTGWGDNEYFQSSSGNGLTGVKMISAGHLHSFALLNNGRVTGWGWNDDGQVAGVTHLNNNSGIFTGNWSNTIVGQLNGVKSIYAGWFHTLAILNDETITGWGLNHNNQISKSSNFQDSNGRLNGNWNDTQAGQFNNIKLINTNYQDSMVFVSGGLYNNRVKVWETNDLEIAYITNEVSQSLNIDIQKINADGSYLYQEDEDLLVSNLSVLY
jgi:alpha-tubulin suppressor-like RCC1 family protein